MKLRTGVLLIFLSITFLFVKVGFSQSPESNQDWLQRGLKARSEGEHGDALRIWFESRSHLESPSTSIGIEFIKLVTEQGIRDYYEIAHSMYMWGLEAEKIEPNKFALEEELQRMRPIVDPSRWDEWNRLLLEENPRLFSELRNFWERLNYLPDHKYNPRLLEHWERLAYVDEHFVQDENSADVRDDRIVHYIRFGPPDHRIETDLACDEKEVKDFVVKYITTNEGIESADGTLGPEEGFDCTDFGTCINKGEAEELAEDVYNYISLSESNTEVEVWAYNAENLESDRHLILTFHKINNSYIRINFVGNMIPKVNFQQKINVSNGANSGNSLLRGLIGITRQYIYVKKLSTFHTYFADLNILMQSQVFAPRNESFGDSHYGYTMNFRNNYRQNQVYTSAPQERSAIKTELSEIPIYVYQYRQLSDDQKPVYATFVESRPTEAFFKDYLYYTNSEEVKGSFKINEDYLNSRYLLRNVYQKLDEFDQPLGLVNHNSFISFQREELSGTSVFIIPEEENSEKQIIYSLFEIKDPKADTERTVNPTGLRGLGKLVFEQPEFFDFESDQLLVSDLIIGYDRDQNLETDSYYPFKVSNDRRIPEDENLVVHFEVYNLKTNTEGFSHFDVEYSFSTISKFFNLFGGKVQESRFTLSYEPRSSRFSESVEIQSDFLKKGEYNLNFRITDKSSGEEVERTVRFEVTESQSTSTFSTIE